MIGPQAAASQELWKEGLSFIRRMHRKKRSTDPDATPTTHTTYGGFKKTDSVRFCLGKARKNWTFSVQTILFRAWLNLYVCPELRSKSCWMACKSNWCWRRASESVGIN